MQVRPNIKLIDVWNPLLKDFVIRRKNISGMLSSSSTMNVVLFSCLHLFHWSPTSCGECRKIQSSHPKPWQVIEYIDQKLQKIHELKSEAKAKHGLMLETECMVLIPTCNICFRSQINTWEASVFLMVKSNVQLQKSLWGNFWSMWNMVTLCLTQTHGKQWHIPNIHLWLIRFRLSLFANEHRKCIVSRLSVLQTHFKSYSLFSNEAYRPLYINIPMH